MINLNKIIKSITTFLILIFSVFEAHTNIVHSNQIVIEPQNAIIQNIEAEIYVKLVDDNNEIVNSNLIVKVYIEDRRIDLYLNNGISSFKYKFNNKTEIFIRQNDDLVATKTITPIPLWMSIFPPLLAILFALIFSEIFISLFLGLYCGTLIIWLHSGQNIITSIYRAFFNVFDGYITNSMTNVNHIYIILFSMMIGGTVFIITRNGGMLSIINYLSKYSKTPQSAQLTSFILGLIIFFDDYANCLIVGKTMRPITDKYKVSREKLAFIVDSTAAPLSSIAFITTWIGAELIYLQSSIIELGLETNAYNILFNSLKYSFYPILALVFTLLIILLNRDFSLMHRCETRAREKGVTSPELENKIQDKLKFINSSRKIENPKIFNAIIPIAVIILGTVLGLLYPSFGSKVWDDSELSILNKLSVAMGMANSHKALLFSSSAGLFTALLLSLITTKIKLKSLSDNMIRGFKTMFSSIVILILAWSLAGLVSDLHTADFITQMFASTSIQPQYIPIMCFVASGIISFCTGSAWGTMAIMYPIILPSTWLICQNYGLSYDQTISIFTHVTSTVIAGAVFGDHCSPISDTTILSSLSSSCNHIQHVRTQLPYALTVAIITIIFGTIPVSLGFNIYLSYILMILACFLVILLIGKKVKNNPSVVSN